MNISGIRSSAGFYDYNTIKMEAVAGNDAQIDSEVEESVQSVSVDIDTGETTRQKADTGARDFAERYQPEATYELVGSESDVKSLDVEKALSDMEKDQVLQQYQFFVGESQAEDVLTVRERENFSL